MLITLSKDVIFIIFFILISVHCYIINNLFSCIEIKVSSVRELAKLRDSEQLQKVISQIEKHSKVPRKSADIVGPVECDPEYQLIVEANNMAVDIDNEIGNNSYIEFLFVKHMYWYIIFIFFSYYT